MIIHDFEQGTEEWFKVRLGKFTATDGLTIFNNGKGVETLAFEKASERLTGKPKAEYTNPDMERGKRLEAIARNSYELETGNLVKTVGFCELDEFIGCSPDGFVEDKGLVEIKCKNDPNYARYLYDGKIDPEHYMQMQFQMFVTDREWVDYVVYNENFFKSTKIVRVFRNETDIAKIKAGLAVGIAQVKDIVEKIK